MDFRMNGTVERAIEKAKEEMKNFKSTRVTDEFLLFALYKEVQYQTVGKCLSNYGFNLFTFRYYLDSKNKNIEEPDFSESSEVELALQTIETLSKAKEYADLTERVEIYSAHLILALLESDNNVIVEYLRDYNIATEMIRKGMLEFIYTRDIQELSVTTKEKKPQKLDKIIEETCTDLTQMALDGKIDPIIGREKEIDAIINTMARRSKNNVLIAAPEGVGKTAIVKGLALKLANNEVPSLANKHIYSLSIGSLMSNSMYR